MFEHVSFNKRAKFCVCVSCLILAVSGLSKLISASGSARILSESDAIFGINNQHLLVAVGALEICVVVALAIISSLRGKLLLIAAVSTNFLLYRCGLWLLDVPRPCPCLGNASAWVHIDPKTLDLIMKGALAWLLLPAICR